MVQPNLALSNYRPDYRAALQLLARHKTVAVLAWLALTGIIAVGSFFDEPTHTMWLIGEKPQIVQATVLSCTGSHIDIAYEIDGKRYRKTREIKGCDPSSKIVDIQYAKGNPDLIELDRGDLHKEAIDTVTGTAELGGLVAFIVLLMGADWWKQGVFDGLLDGIRHCWGKR